MTKPLPAPILILGLATAVSLAARENPPNIHAAVPAGFTTIVRDDRLVLAMHPPVVALDGSRQPYLFATARGTLFCQAQLALPPFNTKGKMVYPDRIASSISRDGGATWMAWTAHPGRDDVNIEGGVTTLADGTILLLDTYVMPVEGKPDHGTIEEWRSRDDLRTVEGPAYVDCYLPKIRWSGSTDDVGRPHNAARLHRSVIELPGGDLITTMYSWFGDDHAPCPYTPTMMKTRTVILRSRDQAASWAYSATVAVDGAVGTEGFGEPVLTRLTAGPHPGRILCTMRTGRDLYQAHSDDDGRTWSRAAAVRFPGVDIYDTSRWAGLFEDTKAPDYLPSDQDYGVVVDPELIEMRDGTLVCSVGVRTPEKRFLKNWTAPTNGDYLAFSCDGGDTWTEVVQFLSGQPTTQYMGIREIAPGRLFVVYDDSLWRPAGRTMGFRLDVARQRP